MRILSMDVGDKRIGMAISDEMGWTAQGLPVLERKNKKYDLAFIGKLIEEYNPKSIVIGLPKNMNGTVGPQGEKVKAFAASLQERFSQEIIFWDERLTTVSAHKAMIEANVSRKERKQRVDQLAAILILQTYLDYLAQK